MPFTETTQDSTPSVSGILDGLLSETTSETPVDDTQDTPETTPVGEETEPVDEPGADVEDEEPDFSDEEAEAAEKDEAGRRIVPKNRFNKLIAANKQLRAMREQLGDVPPVEQIKEAIEVNTDMQMMAADIESGDPERIGRFVQHWSEHNPEAVPAFVESSIVLLRDQNPEAFTELSRVFGKGIVGELYNEAARLKQAGAEDAEEFLYAVKLLDWQISGDYQEELPQKADPVDQRLRTIQEFEERQELEKQRLNQQQTLQWQHNFDKAINDVALTAVGRALEKVAPSFESKPTILNGLRSGLIKDAKLSMSQDRAWSAQFNRMKQFADRTRDPKDANAVIDYFNQRFERAVKQFRPKYIKEATESQLASSSQRHEKLGSQAAKTEPVGGGVTSPISANKLLEDAKSKRDVSAALDAIFGR